MNSGFYTKIELSGVFDWIHILSENSNYLKENFSNKIKASVKLIFGKFIRFGIAFLGEKRTPV